MRVRTGRPHWLIVGEAHHLLPRRWGHVPQRLNESLFVTVHPERLAPSILECIDVVIAVGAAPDKTLREFAAASERPPAELAGPGAEKDEVACWFVRCGGRRLFDTRHRWMRDVIKNEGFAAAVEDIERRRDLSPAQTRTLVRAAVETRYTLPE